MELKSLLCYLKCFNKSLILKCQLHHLQNQIQFAKVEFQKKMQQFLQNNLLVHFVCMFPRTWAIFREMQRKSAKNENAIFWEKLYFPDEYSGINAFTKCFLPIGLNWINIEDNGSSSRKYFCFEFLWPRTHEYAKRNNDGAVNKTCESAIFSERATRIFELTSIFTNILKTERGNPH